MPDVAIIVPARLASQRFPRKLLYPVAGQPLILHTANCIQKVLPDIPLFFGVAEQELVGVLEGAGFRAVMTDPEARTGTDRIAEVNRTVQAATVINVQADEPIINAEQILGILDMLKTDGTRAMTTTARPFPDTASAQSPNHVKVVVNEQAEAMYFSRALIPFDRDQSGEPQTSPSQSAPVYWHQGLYAYQAETLAWFAQSESTPCERMERLEQLRVLESGRRIGVFVTNHFGAGVDCPEDIPLLEERLKAQ